MSEKPKNSAQQADEDWANHFLQVWREFFGKWADKTDESILKNYDSVVKQ